MFHLLKPSTPPLLPFPGKTSETELGDPPTSGSASKLSTNLPSWQMHGHRFGIYCRHLPQMLLGKWLRIHSVGAFQIWLQIRMVWEFYRKYADPWALPLGMIFQWSLVGLSGICSAALNEKQPPHSEHLWRHFFQPSGEALSTEQWMCFVLMDDMNLLNGFFSFSFRFPGNSDPIYNLMLGTGEARSACMTVY